MEFTYFTSCWKYISLDQKWHAGESEKQSTIFFFLCSLLRQSGDRAVCHHIFLAFGQAISVAHRDALVRELSTQAAVLAHIAGLAGAAPPAALAVPTALVGADGHAAVGAAEPILAVAPPLNAVAMPTAHGLARARRVDIARGASVAVVALAHPVVAHPVAGAVLGADFNAARGGAPAVAAAVLRAGRHAAVLGDPLFG